MLLLSLIWAWTAWNVYRPHKSAPELLGVFSFIFGFITGELALHVIAVEFALTLLIVVFGELSGLGDALGLAIALCSWTAIAIFYFRAQRADPIMAQAVRYALQLAPEQTLNTENATLIEPDAKRLAKPFAYKLPSLFQFRWLIGDRGDLPGNTLQKSYLVLALEFRHLYP